MLALSPILGGYLVDHCPLRFRHPEAASALSRWRESEPRPNVLLLGSSRMGSFTQAPSLEETVRNLTGDQSVCIFNAICDNDRPRWVSSWTLAEFHFTHES